MLHTTSKHIWLWIIISCCILAYAGTAHSTQAQLPDISAPEKHILSNQKAQTIGDRFYRHMLSTNAIFPDPELSYYIQNLGDRIRSGESVRPFTFFIVNSFRINAFATPGGYVGINAGLVMASKTEDELASVLAHEIAHVTQDHIARLYQKSGQNAWTQLAAIAAAIALSSKGDIEGSTAAFYAGQALSQQQLINHTRAHEKEADRVGLEYLVKAGYKASGMIDFFKTLQNATLYSDQRFEILRTHPFSQNRVASTIAYAEQLKKQGQFNASTRIPSSVHYTLFKARITAKFANPKRQIKRYLDQKKLSLGDQFTLALLYQKQGLFKKAMTLARTIEKQHPYNPDVQLLLYKLASDLKQPTTANHILDNLITLYPEHTAINQYMIERLLNQKKFKKALNVIHAQEIKYDQFSPFMIRARAQCYKNLNKPTLYRFYLGEFYFMTGQYAQAKIQLNEALRKETDLPTHQKQQAQRWIENIRQEQRRSQR